jgi:hypothetical protein
MKFGHPKLFPVIAAVLARRVPARAETPQHKAWKVIEAGAADNSPAVRAVAVGALGSVRNSPGPAAVAEKALEDEKPKVRTAAARALGEMLYAPSIPKLRKAPADKETSVVMAAAHSLVELKDPAGYAIYYAVLTGERRTGPGLIAQETDVLKDPKNLVHFSLEEGIGFFPFGGYGLSALRFVKRHQREADSAKAVAVRFLANDPDRGAGRPWSERPHPEVGWSGKRRSRRSPRGPTHPFLRRSNLRCSTITTGCGTPRPLPS